MHGLAFLTETHFITTTTTDTHRYMYKGERDTHSQYTIGTHIQTRTCLLLMSFHPHHYHRHIRVQTQVNETAAAILSSVHHAKDLAQTSSSSSQVQFRSRAHSNPLPDLNLCIHTPPCVFPRTPTLRWIDQPTHRTLPLSNPQSRTRRRRPRRSGGRWP